MYVTLCHSLILLKDMLPIGLIAGIKYFAILYFNKGISENLEKFLKHSKFPVRKINSEPFAIKNLEGTQN